MQFGSVAITLTCLLLAVVSRTSATCLSEEELTERSGFNKVLHKVGCTLHKGAARIREGVRDTYENIRGRIAPNKNPQVQPPPPPVATLPTTTDFPLDVRGDFSARSLQAQKVEATTPITIGSKMLFITPLKCPDGQYPDHRNRCRQG